LYKESGYNPMSGCLPMILQMIILFALYNVFNNYFEFRGASFIPGWIDDLSVGDSVWSWEKQIPLITAFTQNNLRLLPIIYTVSQLFNGKITQHGIQLIELDYSDFEHTRGKKLVRNREEDLKVIIKNLKKNINQATKNTR
jgi:membrane protein insertase Oxa1/YidC/SpoIIIJ